MKLLLLAASLVLLGGCVAPGYYVQPDYSAAGGYYGDGYYEGSGGYYPGYYDGCCSSAGVSIGYGYGYGYPTYGWGSDPFGYYGYYGGYYDYGRYRHGGHHHGGHHWDGHGHHGDGGWNGGGGDHSGARPWRQPDHPPIPMRNEAMRTGDSALQQRLISPDIAPHSPPRFSGHFGPRPQSGTARHDARPVHVAPDRPGKRKSREF